MSKATGKVRYIVARNRERFQLVAQSRERALAALRALNALAQEPSAVPRRTRREDR